MRSDVHSHGIFFFFLSFSSPSVPYSLLSLFPEYIPDHARDPVLSADSLFPPNPSPLSVVQRPLSSTISTSLNRAENCINRSTLFLFKTPSVSPALQPARARPEYVLLVLLGPGSAKIIPAPLRNTASKNAPLLSHTLSGLPHEANQKRTQKNTGLKNTNSHRA